jgi:hypothetical protein
LLEWVCDNQVARAIGAVTYTQALNRRGGIESDCTVTRLDEDAFRIVTGMAFGSHDLAWLRKQARRRGTRVRIVDVTGQFACFALWGPRSREILAGLAPADLDNDAFPFMSSQELTVGDVPVPALRVTFRGRAGTCRASTPPDCGRRSGRPGRRTAWSRAGTARSRACAWRRGTACGAATSRPRPTRTKPGWASA